MSSTAPSLDKTQQTLLDVTTQGMSFVWQKVPNKFQCWVIPHLLSMNNYKNDSQAVLLVQGTGGGNSMVYQCAGTILTGVVVAIENNLSLSLDQCSKIGGT